MSLSVGEVALPHPLPTLAVQAPSPPIPPPKLSPLLGFAGQPCPVGVDVGADGSSTLPPLPDLDHELASILSWFP